MYIFLIIFYVIRAILNFADGEQVMGWTLLIVAAMLVQTVLVGV